MYTHIMIPHWNIDCQSPLLLITTLDVIIAIQYFMHVLILLDGFDKSDSHIIRTIKYRVQSSVAWTWILKLIKNVQFYEIQILRFIFKYYICTCHFFGLIKTSRQLQIITGLIVSIIFIGIKIWLSNDGALKFE